LVLLEKNNVLSNHTFLIWNLWTWCLHELPRGACGPPGGFSGVAGTNENIFCGPKDPQGPEGTFKTSYSGELIRGLFGAHFFTYPSYLLASLFVAAAQLSLNVGHVGECTVVLLFSLFKRSGFIKQFYV
jgi:hypothetical protein